MELYPFGPLEQPNNIDTPIVFQSKSKYGFVAGVIVTLILGGIICAVVWAVKEDKKKKTEENSNKAP